MTFFDEQGALHSEVSFNFTKLTAIPAGSAFADYAQEMKLTHTSSVCDVLSVNGVRKEKFKVNDIFVGKRLAEFDGHLAYLNNDTELKHLMGSCLRMFVLDIRGSDKLYRHHLRRETYRAGAAGTSKQSGESKGSDHSKESIHTTRKGASEVLCS
jgi:hypothetical protein